MTQHALFVRRLGTRGAQPVAEVLDLHGRIMPAPRAAARCRLGMCRPVDALGCRRGAWR
jgi:hypothetical protein